MILAGDIGGTKTALAVYPLGETLSAPVRETQVESGRYETLEAVIAEFLGSAGLSPKVASFGVAGPVIEGRARITNLPWVISAERIARSFAIPTVHLLNDLQALATAVPHLGPEALSTLNRGCPAPGGTIAVIAPGTGLGEAFLVWTGSGYLACPTEGGHASFAPTTPEQLELLLYLQHRFGHVSFERVCSGSGIPNLYDYLRESGGYAEPEWLRNELAAARDRTPIIVGAGLSRTAEIGIATLDMFVRILGGVVGNMALKVLATGGLYLGGGIPPRILVRLQQEDFLAAVRDKGRFGSLVANIPLHVILDPKAALEGAAWHALLAEASQETSGSRRERDPSR